MAKTIKMDETVCWIDGQGRCVPLVHIKEEAQQRDMFVEHMVDRAQRLQNLIVAYKAEMQEMMTEYLTELADRYDENWAGNAKITNYSQDKRVELKQANKLTFDETLVVAKSKVDKCIINWSEGASSKIIALVNQAFQVDKRGKVDVDAMIKLTRLDIEDELWQEAMEIIKNSITVESTKQYLNFHVKDGTGKWKSIVLNFSAL